MKASLTFQELLLRLESFWAERGCVIQQPYDVEVGAGTMAPETFLRVLGPAPYKVAYAQPSRRPADGRYGENPNRLYKHTQLQVILKPPPVNVQELYLESLAAIGIDLRQHDIKFEEDNWEAPTLGAWGIGWQVMLDGLEITQFTYFQQCGGVDLDPISAELTYGLERIAAFLQDVNSIYDIVWTRDPKTGKAVTYGDVRMAEELEFSIYNFEAADVEKARKHLELYEAECWSLVGISIKYMPKPETLTVSWDRFVTRNHEGPRINIPAGSCILHDVEPGKELSRHVQLDLQKRTVMFTASPDLPNPHTVSLYPGALVFKTQPVGVLYSEKILNSRAPLPLPALDLCLKCSHLFNILDARGAISVTERVGVIARIRNLAVGVAKTYLGRLESGQEGEPAPAAAPAAAPIPSPGAKPKAVPHG
jgi:glycyl-tRNA synthetase alpha chain